MKKQDLLNRNFEDVLKRNAVTGDDDDNTTGDEKDNTDVDYTGKPPYTTTGTTDNNSGIIGIPPLVKPTFKQKVLSSTDKFGVSQGGSLSGFIWGLAIGVLIVWQWKNIVKVGNSLFSKK